MRSAGGQVSLWRAQFFGAVPGLTTWPEVPVALLQGEFDALQATNERCVSARLWDAGLRFGLIDHQTMNDYIPMLCETFWSNLTPALQTVVTDL